jgi:hypothetical protein
VFLRSLFRELAISGGLSLKLRLELWVFFVLGHLLEIGRIEVIRERFH